MSARKLPQRFIESIAENDETYVSNARLAVASWKCGKITAVQLNTLLEWQRMAAVRRHDHQLRGGAR